MIYASSGRFSKEPSAATDNRLRFLAIALGIFGGLIIVRLFILMVVQHGFYTALAAGSQEMYEKLFPRRGQIYAVDSRTGVEFPVAINRDVFLIYADTRDIHDTDTAEHIISVLGEIFKYTDERKDALRAALGKRTDPYEPIEQKVQQSVADQIKQLRLPGLRFVRQAQRFYPEHALAAEVIGFVGKDKDGNDRGSYGIEGYWHKELAGSGGWLEGAQSAKGNWIPLAGRSFKPATDGVDIVLTIDRILQFTACAKLKASLLEYNATSASLVIMDPKTGAILAMCSEPDFDLNTYGQVTSADVYNNTAIFTPYEPGSIFKPIALSAAINENVVTPATPFHDSGRRDGLCTHPITNAGNKSFGDQTMTGVIQNSINTGMVHIVEELGKKKFIDYVKKYGFGVKTGIELDTEVGGTIQSLAQNKSDRLDCYTATASFGQGITVTPLQITTAFAAIANGGTLLKPYVVKELRYPDGHVERTKPHEITTVLSKRAAELMSGILVKTVDTGYSGRARVPGYYVAGKSGTAEIAGAGGYTKTYNHSFIGFAPVGDPKFVMFVKFEKPERAYAESTAAPVFGELAKFVLDYYRVGPTR